ncbi:MAG: glycosyltransferase family 9 protein [Candidatus Korobacteraceae bacterium]
MRLLLWVLLPTRLAIWRTRWFRPDRNTSSAKRDSIIVFRLDALGDLVLTTPVFRELKRAYPSARITAVAQQAHRSILETNPHIDELLCVPSIGKSRRFRNVRYLLTVLLFYWRELRHRRFDVAISPRWDTDEHLATLLCSLTRATTRVGYSERASAGKQRFNRGFDQAFDICLDAGPLRHEVERNLAIVEALAGNVHDTTTEITLTVEDREYANRVLHGVAADRVLVALGIGAQSPGRRWPLERYSAVIRELSSEFPVHTVITCAPSEHEQAAHLAGALPGGSTISDSAAIRETCAMLERCDLFIGNDTGAAHLAAAMKCSAIVISRHPKRGDPDHPNSPARFAPWGVPAFVLQPERGVDDCDTHCRQISCPHCILQISVPQAVTAAKGMLMQRRQVRDKLTASSRL